MPVQVNEIIIKATVSEGGDAAPAAGGAGGSDPSGKDAIIAECVEQVLEIMKREIKR